MDKPIPAEQFVEERISSPSTGVVSLVVVKAGQEARQRIIDVLKERYEENRELVIAKPGNLEYLNRLMLNLMRQVEDAEAFSEDPFYKVYVDLVARNLRLKFVVIDVFGEDRAATESALSQLNRGRSGFFPNEDIDMIFMIPEESPEAEAQANKVAGDFMHWWDDYCTVE